MPGIFGNLFDFDDDGKLDAVEQTADFLAFEEMTKDDDDVTNDCDDSFSDDDI